MRHSVIVCDQKEGSVAGVEGHSSSLLLMRIERAKGDDSIRFAQICESSYFASEDKNIRIQHYFILQITTFSSFPRTFSNCSLLRKLFGLPLCLSVANTSHLVNASVQSINMCTLHTAISENFA